MNSPANQTGPARPTQFGRYRLRAVIGKGPSSQLAVAEHPQGEGPPAIVALKQYFAQGGDPGGNSSGSQGHSQSGPRDGDGPAQRDAWLQRAQRAARLRHPHLTLCHEVGEVDGTCFASLEYLVAEDLHAVLAKSGERGRFPLETAVHLILQCLSALHAANLPHGSLNPWTLLVTYDGMAKLLDLGTARSGLPRARERSAYCAPEQLAGAAPDATSDVFSAGLLLWECLTGQRPPAGPIERPGSLRAELPAELDAIVLRALERDRSRRYPSALDLGKALEGFARRGPRATSQGIAIWLRGMFGAERVTLRRAISQGVDVERSVQRLAEAMAAPGPTTSARRPPLAQPRALWSTGLAPRSPSSPAVPTVAEPALAAPPARPTPRDVPAVAAAPPVADDELTDPEVPPLPGAALVPVPAPAPPAGRSLRRALAGLAAVAAAGGLVWVLAPQRSPAPAPSAERPPPSTSLRIESTPPGAHILVDGEPSGLTTPALVEGVRAGRSLLIEVNKPGYQPAAQQIEVRAGAVQRYGFTLLEGTGTLRLQGAPAGAAIFVDDVALEGPSPYTLPLGRRRIRLELAGDVVYFGEIDIRRGEQTLAIAAGGARR